ncbi:hypothetical protein K438DRAFT_1182355 [Mycena galopus ATCC 62051]|nr:hypothetical protein K438DRAFT_1182355 [Mycena galopus ATCC 62051]
MFSHCRNFTVTAQTLNNVTNYNTPANIPSAFRIIPLGDIYLRHEIQEIQGIVYRQREQGCVRRVYSAKVEGRKSSMTVVMYQGAGTEDEWRVDLAKYRAVRHPNIVQVYGTGSLGNIHATIFYDDYLALHQDSHFATVYIHAYSNSRFDVNKRHV